VQDALTLIAATLRGESIAEPQPPFGNEVVQIAAAHGVAPLLARRARLLRWQGEPASRLAQLAAGEAAWSLARTGELRRVLDGLSRSGISSLLLKGAHLAHSHYASPEDRPHSDVDLLIHESAREHAGRALQALGYQRLAHVTGEVAFTQMHYWRVDATGLRHALDVHWRICGPRVFADRLTWSELTAARGAVPGLGPSAFGPSAGHALIVACLHRTAHHGNSERLIWMHDIHLLASRLTDAEWLDVTTLAAERGVAGVVTNGLAAAARWFGTTVPHAAAARLTSPDVSCDPAALAFLRPGRTGIDVLLSDFRALSGWRQRWRFAREHLLPSPDYIAHRYGTSSRGALPFLYAHRVLTGWRRWL
jgi:hypothetical protein